MFLRCHLCSLSEKNLAENEETREAIQEVCENISQICERFKPRLGGRGGQLRIWRILFQLAIRRIELVKTVEQELVCKVAFNLTIDENLVCGRNENPQMPLALIDGYSLAYAAELYMEMPVLKEGALAIANRLNVPSITKELEECIKRVEGGKGIILVSWKCH